MSDGADIRVTSGIIDPRLAIGGNKPPKTPFERSEEEISNLFEEATHWCNGDGVNTEAEEANVDELLGMLRDAKKTADGYRAAEKKPHDDAAKAVQAQWLPIINKADLAADACKKALAPYRKRIADEKAAIAEAARLAAEAKRKAAEDAFRASQVDDLAGRAKAEALLDEAKKADKVASKADKAATTGLGLRTSYQAEITDMSAFARYCWTNHKAEVDEFFETLAKQLVARKVMTMPGVTVHEIRGAI